MYEKVKVFPHKNEEFAELVDKLPPLSWAAGPWIAGGCALNLFCGNPISSSDIDFFFASVEQREQWRKKLTNNSAFATNKSGFSTKNLLDDFVILDELLCRVKQPNSVEYVCDTGNAETFHYYTADEMYQLQLIKKYTGANCQEIWSKFDFNICCVAADRTHVYVPEEIIPYIERRIIKVSNEAIKENLALRTLKYHIKGWKIPDSLFKQAIEQVTSGEIKWEMNY
jgi:hypothetical protein